ncbi:hypothetical protein OEZ85_001582 [Tetradesmus obliquus]|uniref:CRC domain-containing protein n=1 Tax=Tetradesmus obliquus TaxID=3088 RepID=A0ABY8U0G6_TETOB|nr:hypothetical protein OEZ85_001582 [Tetradesmus obliquus]
MTETADGHRAVSRAARGHLQPHHDGQMVVKLRENLPRPDRVATMVCKCESGGSCNCGSNCDCSEDCFCASCAGGQAKRVAATGCNMCSSHACKCSEGSCGCGDKCKCPKCAKA